MGFDKVVTPLAGVSPLESIVRALREREAVIVVPSRLAGRVAEIAPDASLAINDEPERGMSHSLRAGLRYVAVDRAFGVLLGDMPAITDATLARTEALLDGVVDVAHPVDARGNPGHPVIFSVRMRAAIEALPDGDTLRSARERAVRRATWHCRDRSAFLDLDDPAQWEASLRTSARRARE
jgi:CTP:molybdopterin cytidylyltransferase MocA